MADDSFRHVRRVEFGETDLAGIVHFSNFFRYMEAAETAFLRNVGFSVAWETPGGRFGFPRVSATCDYLSPARFEDELTIAVGIEKLGRSSVSYVHEFSCGIRKIAVGRITSVFCRHDHHTGMKSLALPPELRAALEPHVIADEEAR